VVQMLEEAVVHLRHNQYLSVIKDHRINRKHLSIITNGIYARLTKVCVLQTP